MEPDRPTIDEIVARLREALRRTPAEQAYLFGSWSRGDADRYSDLDLAVICETRRPFLERHRDFDPLYALPWNVDLLVYRSAEVEQMVRAGNGFMEEITSKGLRLL